MEKKGICLNKNRKKTNTKYKTSKCYELNRTLPRTIRLGGQNENKFQTTITTNIISKFQEQKLVVETKIREQKHSSLLYVSVCIYDMK